MAHEYSGVHDGIDGDAEPSDRQRRLQERREARERLLVDREEDGTSRVSDTVAGGHDTMSLPGASFSGFRAGDPDLRRRQPRGDEPRRQGRRQRDGRTMSLGDADDWWRQGPQEAATRAMSRPRIDLSAPRRRESSVRRRNDAGKTPRANRTRTEDVDGDAFGHGRERDDGKVDDHGLAGGDEHGGLGRSRPTHRQAPPLGLRGNDNDQRPDQPRGRAPTMARRGVRRDGVDLEELNLPSTRHRREDAHSLPILPKGNGSRRSSAASAVANRRSNVGDDDRRPERASATRTGRGDRREAMGQRHADEAGSVISEMDALSLREDTGREESPWAVDESEARAEAELRGRRGLPNHDAADLRSKSRSGSRLAPMTRPLPEARRQPWIEDRPRPGVESNRFLTQRRQNIIINGAPQSSVQMREFDGKVRNVEGAAVLRRWIEDIREIGGLRGMDERTAFIMATRMLRGHARSRFSTRYNGLQRLQDLWGFLFVLISPRNYTTYYIRVFNSVSQNEGEDVMQFDQRFEKYKLAVEEATGTRKPDVELMHMFRDALGGEVKEKLEFMYARDGPESYEDLLADAVYVEQVIAESKRTALISEKRRLEEAAEVEYVAMAKSGPVMNAISSPPAKNDSIVMAIDRQGDRYEKVLNSQAELFKRQENIRQKQVDMMYTEIRQLKEAQDEVLQKVVKGPRNYPSRPRMRCAYCGRDHHTIERCHARRADQDRVNKAYQQTKIEARDDHKQAGKPWVPKAQQSPVTPQDARREQAPRRSQELPVESVNSIKTNGQTTLQLLWMSVRLPLAQQQPRTTRALIDTGSTITLMDEALYSGLRQAGAIPEYHKSGRRVVAAGENELVLKGTTMLPMQLTGTRLSGEGGEASVLVEVAVEVVQDLGLDLLLGLDFLEIGQTVIQVPEDRLKFRAWDLQVTGARHATIVQGLPSKEMLFAAEDLALRPRGIAWLQVQVSDFSLLGCGDFHGLVESRTFNDLRSTLAVGRQTMDLSSGRGQIEIRNLTSKDLEIPKYEAVARFTVAQTTGAGKPSTKRSDVEATCMILRLRGDGKVRERRQAGVVRSQLRPIAFEEVGSDDESEVSFESEATASEFWSESDGSEDPETEDGYEEDDESDATECDAGMASRVPAGVSTLDFDECKPPKRSRVFATLEAVDVSTLTDSSDNEIGVLIERPSPQIRVEVSGSDQSQATSAAGAPEISSKEQVPELVDSDSERWQERMGSDEESDTPDLVDCTVPPTRKLSDRLEPDIRTTATDNEIGQVVTDEVTDDAESLVGLAHLEYSDTDDDSDGGTSDDMTEECDAMEREKVSAKLSHMRRRKLEQRMNYRGHAHERLKAKLKGRREDSGKTNNVVAPSRTFVSQVGKETIHGTRSAADRQRRRRARKRAQKRIQTRVTKGKQPQTSEVPGIEKDATRELTDDEEIQKRRTASRVDGSIPSDEELRADFSEYAKGSIDSVGETAIEGFRFANDLTEDQRTAILAVLDEFRSQFVSDVSEFRPSNLPEVHLDVGDAKPVAMSSGKMNPHKLEVSDEAMEYMIAADVVEPSNSEWRARLVFVKKTDGNIRVCVDHRGLNKHIKLDRYEGKTTEEMFDALQGKCYFANLDLKSGYWQLRLDAASREKTAFGVKGKKYSGTYQFKVLPMGCAVSGAAFTRAMGVVTSGLDYRAAMTYLDDCVIFGATFDEFLANLREFLQNAEVYKLQFARKKSAFGKRLRLLGHVVSANGVEPDVSKVAAIVNFPRPTNKKELRSYLGLSNYYRRYCPNHSALVYGLTKLIRNEAKFSWGPEQESAFQYSKKVLLKHPIVVHPDFSKPFTVMTDASTNAIGAILTQHDAGGRERMVACISRTLKDVEKRYDIRSQEALAIYWSVTRLKDYLLGTHFKVVTDHQRLKWLFKCTEGRLGRYAAALAQFDMDIVYRKGTLNNADAVSRVSIPNADDTRRVFVVSDGLNRCPSRATILKEQKDDTIFGEIYAKLAGSCAPLSKDAAYVWNRMGHDRLQVDGQTQLLTVVEEKTTRVVIPPALREKIIRHFHCGRMGAHMGRDATLSKMKKRFTWLGMYDTVGRFIQACDHCTVVKATKIHDHGHMQLFPASSPGEVVHLDLSGPYPPSNKGSRYVLSCIDRFSMWPEAMGIPDMRAETCANAFIDMWISRHSVPESILTDLGTQFSKSLMQTLTRLLGCEQRFTAAYTPQTNSKIERYHRVLRSLLRLQVLEYHGDWETFLQPVLFAMRTSTSRALGESPFFVLRGVQPRLLSDSITGYPGIQRDHAKIATNIAARVATAQRQAKLHMERYDNKRKEIYDKGRAGAVFKRGDQVLVQHPIYMPGPKKLQTPFSLHTVIGMVSPVRTKIKDSKGVVSVVHVRRLRMASNANDNSGNTKAGESTTGPTVKELTEMSQMQLTVRSGDEVLFQVFESRISEEHGMQFLAKNGDQEKQWYSKEWMRTNQPVALNSFMKQKRTARAMARQN